MDEEIKTPDFSSNPTEEQQPKTPTEPQIRAYKKAYHAHLKEEIAQLKLEVDFLNLKKEKRLLEEYFKPIIEAEENVNKE